MTFKHFRVLIGAALVLALVVGGSLTIAARSNGRSIAQAATPASTTTATEAATVGAAAIQATSAKPVITAQVNGETYAGTEGSYCWPLADAAPCVIVDDPQPTITITVKAGDALTFVIAPPADALQTFKATLLDDKDATGNPLQSDLSTSKGVFTVDASLTSGAHRLQIDAVYLADANGSQNFISTVFALDVGGGALAQSTANATMSSAITEAATVEVTTTEAATKAATVELATTEAALATTPAPLFATTTPSPTRVPPTIVPTKVAPTAVPATSVPTVEVTATLAPPTEAASPEANATNPAISLSNLAPTLMISTGGQTYSPVAISAVVQEADGTQITITRPVNTNAPYIRAAPGSDAQIAFSGPLPTAESVTLGNSDGTKTLSRKTVTPDPLVLYALPTAPGVYVLTIEVQWPGGQATYYFRAVVSG